MKFVDGSGVYSNNPGDIISTGLSPIKIIVGDLNRDSKTDIIALNAVPNQIMIYSGLENGAMSISPEIIALSNEPIDIKSTDYNGDFITDLIVSMNPGLLEIYIGNGDGSFQIT